MRRMTQVFTFMSLAVLGFNQLFHGLTSLSQEQVTQSAAEHLSSNTQPFVIAHRGLSMLAPENTIPAFEMAMQCQSDWIELDYYHTSDGIPVCFHDSSVFRTSNARELFGEARKKPVEYSMEEFSKMDCGSWFSQAFAGAGAPTLEEAVEFITRESYPLIERKRGDAATLCNLLSRNGWQEKVAVQSFDWSFINQCHQQLPNLALGVLGPIKHYNGEKVEGADQWLTPVWAKRAKTNGASFIGWNKNVTQEGIEAAHKSGLKVFVYTINDPELAASLISMGVDGIITDNPALAWKGIAQSAVKPK